MTNLGKFGSKFSVDFDVSEQVAIKSEEKILNCFSYVMKLNRCYHFFDSSIVNWNNMNGWRQANNADTNVKLQCNSQTNVVLCLFLWLACYTRQSVVNAYDIGGSSYSQTLYLLSMHFVLHVMYRSCLLPL